MVFNRSAHCSHKKAHTFTKFLWFKLSTNLFYFSHALCKSLKRIVFTQEWILTNTGENWAFNSIQIYFTFRFFNISWLYRVHLDGGLIQWVLKYLAVQRNEHIWFWYCTERLKEALQLRWFLSFIFLKKKLLKWLRFDPSNLSKLKCFMSGNKTLNKWCFSKQMNDALSIVTPDL